MQKIIFNAQFTNDHSRIQTLSGRLGNFIFRTDSKTGQISAFYKPKKLEFPAPSSSQSRAIIESLSSQLREITAYLGLSIASFNFDLQ